MLHAGTSIVIIMTGSEIWVGADSRLISVGNQQGVAAAVCKIHQFGCVFYVHAGLLKDTAGRYDPADVAKQAATGNRTVLGAAEAFQARVTTSLVTIAGELRAMNREYYQSKILNKAALQTAFFGVCGGTPRLTVRKFTIHEDARGEISASVERLDCPGDCPSGMTWAFLGESSAGNRFLDEYPGYLQENGYRATLEMLIGQEARANPDLVSLPVDILHVGGSGAEWIQKKAGCPAVS